MTTLQQQARALGDGTRHAIFRYVADAGRAVGVAELAAHLALNHNAIRQHLGKLVDAGLVVESTAHRGSPGRPRLEYRIHPATDSRWGVTGPYERLSLLLAEVIRTGETPVEVGARASLEYHKESPTADGVIAHVADTMARLGFEPELSRHGTRVEMLLATCPFASAVLTDRDPVCALHLGLAQGLTAGSDVVVDELLVGDPRRADCRLRLHVEPAAG